MPDLARQLPPELTDSGPPPSVAPGPLFEHATVQVAPPHRGRLPWFTPFRLVLAVVVIAGTVVAVELTGGSSPTYRTAVVGTGTAVATLESVATVTPVDHADLSFDVAGTVGAVDVSVGQQVSAGQVVASLDTTQLQVDVVSAQASLASDQLTLVKDQASQTSAAVQTASSTSSPSPGASSGTPTATQPTSGQHGASDQQIQSLQSTLLADQQQQDADSQAATAALQAATAACEGSKGAVTSESPSFRPPPPTTTTAPGSGGAPPCSSALSAASAAQTRLSAAIKTVGKDESALNAALEASTGSGGGSGGGTAGGSTGARGSSGASTSGVPASSTALTSSASASASVSPSSASAPSPGASSGSSKAKPATAGQLAVDQASIDAAQANLADAQQALGSANLVSTISGTVASISIAPGGSVSSGSGTGSAQIVVIGSGSSYQAVADVPVSRIASVALGQHAVVTPDSTNAALGGTVTAIGVLGATSSTTTTYPVTVSLSSPDLGQFSGAEAEVSIVTRTAPDTTTVPSSAVRTVGSRHLVTVLGADGATKSVLVTVGTVGDILTQVTSGVSKGQVVVLADYGEPVPSSSTTTGRIGLGAGTFTGGGTGGGSFAGGGLGGSVRGAAAPAG